MELNKLLNVWINKKVQNPHILEASTKWHSDMQVLPVIILNFLDLNTYCSDSWSKK